MSIDALREKNPWEHYSIPSPSNTNKDLKAKNKSLILSSQLQMSQLIEDLFYWSEIYE